MASAPQVPHRTGPLPQTSSRRLPAWILAAVAAAVYLLLDPHSADHVAQEYRAQLFRDHGFTLWNNGWYSGHHVPGYSVLFPPVAALIGTGVTAALACVAAAWCFERLAEDQLGAGARAAALWFAPATTINLFTGRLTFALGVAVGLAAVLSASRGRTPLAAALAILTSLTSPVAGAFVALGAGAWWLGAPRERAAGQCHGGALAPVALMTLLFPSGGSFPFVASSFWPASSAPSRAAFPPIGVAKAKLATRASA